MKLCITAGNYHIFKLMIKNHKDSRIQLKNIHPLDFDLVFDVYTPLNLSFNWIIYIKKQFEIASISNCLFFN